MEALHPGGAAERAAARAAAVQALRLVAHADLAQLDARLEAARQVLHELAEVHPLLGGEEEGDAVAPERHLDLGQIHLQLAQLDPLPAVVERLRLERAVLVFLVEILFFRLADDLARDVAGALELDERGIAQDHRRERLSMLALHHDPVTEAQPQAARVEEELPARAAQGNLHDLRHDRTSMTDAFTSASRCRRPGSR